MGIQDDIDRFLASGDVAALREIADSAPKADAKLARRALHVLASKGVKVPEARPVGDKIFKPAVVQFETESAVAMPDSVGTALVSVARAGAAGGIALVVAGLNARQGFEFAWERAVGKKEYREIMEHDLRGGLRFHKMPGEIVAGLLGDARRRREGLSQSIPQAVASLPQEWFADPGAPAPTADPAIPATGNLFSEPEFQTWIPPRGFLVHLEARLYEADASPLLIDTAQKLERINAVLSEATAEYFDAKTRKDYAWRLGVAALVFEVSGRAEAAAAARTAGAELADGHAAIEGCGFGRTFLRRLFKVGPSEKDGEPDAAPAPERLIVTPGEFAAEMARKTNRPI